MTRARQSPASTLNSLVGMHLEIRGGVGEVGRSDFCMGGGRGGGRGFVSSDFRLPDALMFVLLLAIGF